MAEKRKSPHLPTARRARAPGLRSLADHLGLSQTTVSIVLNQSPGASAIPQDTKDRVIAAAKELGYRPNFVARALRRQRTLTVGVMVPQVGDGYCSRILLGIEEQLSASGYFYIVASHRRLPARLSEYPQLLMERSVEGLIFIDTTCTETLPLPTVAISGHQHVPGVTSVVLDHRRVAELALQHLKSLGHKRIAFIRGQPFSADSKDRWDAIASVARELDIPILPELTMQLEEEVGTPAVGYPVMKRFLARDPSFSAVFAYNDISAIGVIRALADQNIHVPRDISVVGIDDIDAAEFQTPSLTTVRQPLFKMGQIAAQALLDRLADSAQTHASTIAVEPELIVRESTAPAR